MAVPLTLKVFKGGQLVLTKDYDRDIIKIGRLSSAHLCLDDDKVSRIHSVIEVSPTGALSIIDMGSVEGTFVNGKRVSKGALVFGDEIRVGNTTIQVDRAGAAPSIAPPVAAVATSPMQMSAMAAPPGQAHFATQYAPPQAYQPPYGQASMAPPVTGQVPAYQPGMVPQGASQPAGMMMGQAGAMQGMLPQPVMPQQVMPQPGTAVAQHGMPHQGMMQPGMMQQPAMMQPGMMPQPFPAQPPVAISPPQVALEAPHPMPHGGHRPPVVVDEATGEQVRTRPKRRKGTGPLGLELRFLWGDHMVGEFFLAPDRDTRFTVGSAEKVDFVIGDGKLPGPRFELVHFGKGKATLSFTSKMNGEIQRRHGEELVTLEDAKKRGLAEAGKDGHSITLEKDDFAWVDLGGVVVEVFFQPQPKKVLVPFMEAVDFTVLNIFLVCFFLAALFVISAANREAEGDEFDDELNTNQTRIAKLLIKPPENKKNPILEKFEKIKAEKAAEPKALKVAGEESKMGSKTAPERNAKTAPKGQPNNKDTARTLANNIFGGNSPGGLSTVFGHAGIGGELKSALGNVVGTAPGDAAGLGGLGLRGTKGGMGVAGTSQGIGAIGTRGRATGNSSYGTGVGNLSGKKSVDPIVTSDPESVVGSLDKELIRQVIIRNRGAIRYCYEIQLNRFPNLSGKVAVKFVIQGEGNVSTAQVAQSTVGNPDLEQCVVGKVKTWQFPKPKGGGMVVVTYPFIFKQGGQ